MHGGLSLVRLNYNLPPILVADTDVLVSDQTTKHLVQWHVHYVERGWLVDAHNGNVLKFQGGTCRFGNLLENEAQRFIAYSQGYLCFFPITSSYGILRSHADRQKEREEDEKGRLTE